MNFFVFKIETPFLEFFGTIAENIQPEKLFD